MNFSGFLLQLLHGIFKISLKLLNNLILRHIILFSFLFDVFYHLQFGHNLILILRLNLLLLLLRQFDLIIHFHDGNFQLFIFADHHLINIILLFKLLNIPNQLLFAIENICNFFVLRISNGTYGVFHFFHVSFLNVFDVRFIGDLKSLVLHEQISDLFIFIQNYFWSISVLLVLHLLMVINNLQNCFKCILVLERVV